MTFFDIDGGCSQDAPNFYDEIRLRTPGVATVADNTLLDVIQNPDGTLSFDGSNTGEVPGQAGSFDGDAPRVAVGHSIENTAKMEFDWLVQKPGVNNKIDGQNRTLFFAGELLFQDPGSSDDVVVGPSPVPLPASMLFLLAGLGGLAFLRRS